MEAYSAFTSSVVSKVICQADAGALQRVLDAACAEDRLAPGSKQAHEIAGLLICWFTAGVTDESSLLAAVTAREVLPMHAPFERATAVQRI